MANSAKDLQLRELKDTISELKTLVKTLQETITVMNAREAELRQERDNLKEEVGLLTKKLFGASSERRKGTSQIEGQISLFDVAPDVFNEAEAETDPSSAETAEEQLKTSPKPRKKKATQAETFAGLPVKKRYIEIPEDKRICESCGTPLEEVGEEFDHREVEFIPAKIRVIEYYSKTMKCPKCEEDELPFMHKGRDYDYMHRLHGMASASTVAWVMYQKYCNCLPLYRQEKDWAQYGLPVGRATLAHWIIKNAEEFLEPLYKYFGRELLKRTFLMADETPVQVLKEAGRRAETKSYMWLYRTGEDEGPPIVLYKYSETRAGYNAADFLKGFTGYLMCDGYSGYNLVKSAKRCSCWAHVRRYLLDAVPKGRNNDYTLPAVQGVLYVDRLFDQEKKIKEKYKTPEAIKEARLQKEKPILEGFWSWLKAQHPVKGGRLDKAITYIRNRRPFLETYLEDGRCSFSNNASERSVKPFVMGRKNWLFSDTPKGAVASEQVYSIIETAKANGVNVYHYLTWLLEKGPSSLMSDQELEQFAPWKEEVKLEIQRRVDAHNTDD